MPEPKTLRVVAAYGRPGTTTTLLAAHPDEMFLPTRELAPNRRTLVLALKGDKASFVAEHPAPLVRAWMSTNGTAYCTALNTTKIHLSRGGVWTEEEFSPTPIDMVADIFGFPGETSADDVVFATARGKLFIRKGGKWTEYAAPSDMKLGNVHGRDPNDMYVGGEQLLHFDGTQLEEIEDPDHTVRAVWVTQDDRLIGGWDLLSITTADGGWEPVETKIQDFMDLAELNGEVYAGTFDEGVLKVYPGPVARSSPAYGVAKLFTTGETLIAIHKGVARVFDGKTWQDVSVPSCEIGKRPA